MASKIFYDRNERAVGVSNQAGVLEYGGDYFFSDVTSDIPAGVAVLGKTRGELLRLEASDWVEAKTQRGMGALTEAQEQVLSELRAAGMPILAEAVERHWLKGEHYYIDARVNVSKRLRARFEELNDKLLAAEDERFESAQKKGGA